LAKAWTKRGAPRTLKPPSWPEIWKDETQRIAELIAHLSWRDPDLRRRLAKYLEKLQSESPVPAE